MSQQSIPILSLTLIAAGTVAEHRLIDFSGAQATTLGQKVLGPAMTDATNNQTLGVVAMGTAIVESGAAFAVGDSLTTDTQGRAVVATGSNFIVADAMHAASAAGERIEVLLRR